MIRKKALLILPILVAFCLFWLPLAHAQLPEQVVITYPAAEPQADSMALSVFFTVVDETGQPIPDPDIDSAEIQLVGDASSPVPAIVENPQTPFYIALLLDASGSMNNAMAGVREAALAALEKAPPPAHFAVFKFNELEEDEPLRPIEGFTDDRVLTRGGINAVQADPNAPTCLYNALYETIQLVDDATQAPQERQAIILFTDGKDERADGTPCSQRQQQDVINRAIRDVPITPIHTIGLCTDAQCNNIDTGKLFEMAEETFAFSATGNQEQLGVLFQRIMEGLNSQRVARANVYPRQGPNNAVLKVTLRDGRDLTGTFQFSSDRDYAEPANVKIQITGAGYNNSEDFFHLALRITDPEFVQQVIIQTWDNKRGQIFPDHIFEPDSTGRIEIKPEGFLAGNEYIFKIIAKDKNGEDILDEEGNLYIVESDPIPYLPDQSDEISFLIESATPNYQANKLVIILNDIPDEERIASYEGYILEAETSNRIIDFGPEVYQGNQIEVDLPEAIEQIQEETSYRVVVELTTKEDIPSEAEQEFKAVPQEPPGLMLTIWLALNNNLPVTLSIVVIILCVTIVLVYWSRPSKKNMLPPPLPRPPIDQTMISASASSVDAPQPQPRSRPQRLRLKVLKSPNPIQETEKLITSFPFVIGRDDCDFNIPDQRISRRHIEITSQDGKFFITDLDSRNGTFLGTLKLPPNQPTPLNSSTVVRLGQQTHLQLEP